MSGQRCQTLQALDIDNMTLLDNECRFTITAPLKHTGVNKSQAPIVFKAYGPSEALCVVSSLKVYLSKTEQFRTQQGSSQLLLSFSKPHRPVSTDPIARWIRTVLKLAGVGDQFTAHSTRAAATSAAKRNGMTLDQIMKCAGWSNATTFARFYDKPCESLTLSEALLH